MSIYFSMESICVIKSARVDHDTILVDQDTFKVVVVVVVVVVVFAAPM